MAIDPRQTLPEILEPDAERHDGLLRGRLDPLAGVRDLDEEAAGVGSARDEPQADALGAGGLAVFQGVFHERQEQEIRQPFPVEGRIVAQVDFQQLPQRDCSIAR